MPHEDEHKKIKEKYSYGMVIFSAKGLPLPEPTAPQDLYLISAIKWKNLTLCPLCHVQQAYNPLTVDHHTGTNLALPSTV